MSLDPNTRPQPSKPSPSSGRALGEGAFGRRRHIRMFVSLATLIIATALFPGTMVQVFYIARFFPVLFAELLFHGIR